MTAILCIIALMLIGNIAVLRRVEKIEDELRDMRANHTYYADHSGDGKGRGGA